MLAGRVADKHALQHLLNHPQAARIADKVGAEDAGAGRAKGHVVAQDAVLVAVVVLDGGERLVRLLVAVGLVVELHVVQLGAADDGLLGLGREAAPGLDVVDVLLHDDVAAAGARGVLAGDEHGVGHGGADRVGGAVDEAEQVAGVKVAEALRVVDDGGGVAQLGQQLALKLEADVAAVGADVEQQVARRGHGRVLGAADLAEGVQLGGAAEAGARGEGVPGVGADADGARELRVEVAQDDVFGEVADGGEHGADGFDGGGGGRVDGEDEEGCGFGEGCLDGLVLAHGGGGGFERL